MRFELGKIDGRVFVVEGKGIPPTEVPKFDKPEELAFYLQGIADERGSIDVLDGTSGTLVVRRITGGTAWPMKQ